MAAPDSTPKAASRCARILISAGDASGDRHAANLVCALRQQVAHLEVASFGGRALRDAGAEELFPLADNPVMGFRRVAGRIGEFVTLLSRAERFLDVARPDLVVLVDYPGFNVNLAQLARRHGVKTCYYICPQYWAWAPWRARRFARCVDRALVIFPFEVEYWARLGVSACPVGHPAADLGAGQQYRPREHPDWVAVLPGSRRQEVEQNLPWLLDVATRLQQGSSRAVTLVTCLARADLRNPVETLAARAGARLEILPDPLEDLLPRCRLALACSGTVTVQCAFAGVPTLVLYRVTGPSLWLSRYLLTSPFIAQPNLLAGRTVVPEFLAARHPGEAMAAAAAALLAEGPARARCLRDLEELRTRHGSPGASRRAAREVALLLEGLDGAVNRTLERAVEGPA